MARYWNLPLTAGANAVISILPAWERVRKDDFSPSFFLNRHGRPSRIPWDAGGWGRMFPAAPERRARLCVRAAGPAPAVPPEPGGSPRLWGRRKRNIPPGEKRERERAAWQRRLSGRLSGRPSGTARSRLGQQRRRLKRSLQEKLGPCAKPFGFSSTPCGKSLGYLKLIVLNPKFTVYYY